MGEVQKMKEKGEHMQNLLKQRKEKLQITEELMAEKEGEKKKIDKQIEATKRRENYVENQIMETVMFEKPPKKEIKLCLNSNLYVISLIYLQQMINVNSFSPFEQLLF